MSGGIGGCNLLARLLYASSTGECRVERRSDDDEDEDDGSGLTWIHRDGMTLWFHLIDTTAQPHCYRRTHTRTHPQYSSQMLP